MTIEEIVSQSIKNFIAESHGNKKHNGPKDYLAANRKGQRDADMEINGPGFKSGTKIHKTAKRDKSERGGKVNVNNYERFVDENTLVKIVAESVKKFINEEMNVGNMDFHDSNYTIDSKPFQDDENKNIIYHAAYGTIDYLYNEGVINYNDKNICAMVSGEKTIDYCDLIESMLYCFKTKLDNEAGLMLKNYCNLSKKYGKTTMGEEGAINDVEEAISLALKNFAEDGNCCNWYKLGY